MDVIPKRSHLLTQLTESKYTDFDKDHVQTFHDIKEPNNFVHLRKSGYFSDAIIWVEGVDFHVHRNILACCSEYFRALFTDKLQHSHCDEIHNLEAMSGGALSQIHYSTRFRQSDKTSRPTHHSPAGEPCQQIKKHFNDETITKSGSHHPSKKTNSPFEVTITDISWSTMNHVLEHAYGGVVTPSQDNVEQILTAADRFQITSLVHKCCDFLTLQLSTENCISLIKFSSNFYDCHRLKEAACGFFLDTFETVFQTSPEFVQLTPSELCSFLIDDNLNAKREESILEAIIKWVCADEENREGYIPTLVRCTRIGSMLPGSYMLTPVPCDHDYTNNQVMVKVMSEVVEIEKQLMVGANYTMFLPRLPRDLMFIIGGSNFGFPLGLMEVYDCRTWTWNVIGPYDFAPRSYHGLACLDNEIYIIGGFDGQSYLSSCCKLNSGSGALAWESVTPMNTKRCYVGVAQVQGVIYAIGGYDGVYRLNSAEKFDSKRNQWSFISPMSQQRSDAGVAALNDKVYVCGGFSGTECLGVVEMYDPVSEEWSQQPCLPQGRSGLGLTAHNGRLYAVGGFDGVDSSVRLGTMECYNPQTGQWTGLMPMPHPRSNLAVAILEGTLYAIGGYNGDRTSRIVECYEFETNSWFQSTCLSQNRSALSVCVLSGLSNTSAILGRDSRREIAWN